MEGGCAWEEGRKGGVGRYIYVELNSRLALLLEYRKYRGIGRLRILKISVMPAEKKQTTPIVRIQR